MSPPHTKKPKRPDTKPLTRAEQTLLLQDAFDIAIEFEQKVRDCYAGGTTIIKDPKGIKVFAALAHEEQSHIDYLESCMLRWAAGGTVTYEPLASSLPTPEWVKTACAKHLATADYRRLADQHELDLLKVAVQLEDTAGVFYRGLVERLPVEHRALFEQFLTIEEGHLAIVRAELDAVAGLGFWFDIPEFALEAE